VTPLFDKSILQFVDLVTLFLGTMIVAVAVGTNSTSGIGLVKPGAAYETVELEIPYPADPPNGSPVVSWDASTTSIIVIPQTRAFSVLISARQYPPNAGGIEVQMSPWVNISTVQGQLWNGNNPDGDSFSSAKLSLLKFIP
jgi:hypothetical protein